ncbi:hypothetical protein F0U62_35095 [Cystobacter fuscus]|uniref:hypothetical protein n=1 Tax=Cystobacter fuscus TaxID=43 RepID=UPI002B2AA53D|nr:hypothetical protein F0U62_35095 [Cystobacter fuscus]
MKQFTNADPATTLKELGDLLLATHIDQYANFFNVIPGPRMPTNDPVLQVSQARQKSLSTAAKLK